MSVGLSFQVKKRKSNFQDGGHGGNQVFQIETILAIFALQVTPLLPIKFKSLGLSVQEKKRKNKFLRWRPWDHLGFRIGTILTTFD